MAVPPEEEFEDQVALAPMSSGEIWVINLPKIDAMARDIC